MTNAPNAWSAAIWLRQSGSGSCGERSRCGGIELLDLGRTRSAKTLQKRIGGVMRPPTQLWRAPIPARPGVAPYTVFGTPELRAGRNQKHTRTSLHGNVPTGGGQSDDERIGPRRGAECRWSKAAPVPHENIGEPWWDRTTDRLIRGGDPEGTERNSDDVDTQHSEPERLSDARLSVASFLSGR